MCHQNNTQERLGQVEDMLATVLTSERITARRLTLIEQQLDDIQSQNEELLFRKFTARYYSETLFSVKYEYEAEVAQFQRFRRVLLKLVCHLPEGEQRDGQRLLNTAGPKVRHNGDLTISQVEL